MTTPSHIFVPYQGTDKDESLLRVACQLAKVHHARLSVANIVKVPMAFRVDADDVPGLEEANRIMDEAETIAKSAGVEIATDVLAARDTAAAIVQAASTAGADVIFMEAGPANAESRQTMGGTVEYVIEKAACHVWVSRMAGKNTG